MKKYSFLLSGLALLMLGAGTVNAETTNVVNGSSLAVTKSFDLMEGVLAPKTDFTFTVTSQKLAIPNEHKDGLDVYEGIIEGLDNSSKVISYENTDTQTTKVKNISFDFSNVKYEKPGIYRYLVTETKGNTPGVTYSEKKYIVDVYVLNENKQLKPTYIVSHEEGQTTKEPIKFDNKFKTTSLQVKKSVKGNAGDRNKEFNFKITLNANEYYATGSVIKAKINKKDGSVSEQKLVIGENNVKLKDSEFLTIDKMPIGITYKVTEDMVDGYQQTATLDNDGNGINQAEDYKFTDQVSDDTPDEITVTNTKNVNTPTGVAMTIAPYAAVTLVGVGGALYLLKKKKA